MAVLKHKALENIKVKELLTSFASDTLEVSAVRAESWIVDSLEIWIAILLIWHFGADLSHAQLQDLVRAQNAELQSTDLLLLRPRV